MSDAFNTVCGGSIVTDTGTVCVRERGERERE